MSHCTLIIQVVLTRICNKVWLRTYYLITDWAPLWVHPAPPWDVIETKHKAVFHSTGAYLASESMWDTPGNKGASLHPPARWAYPFAFLWLHLFNKLGVGFKGQGAKSLKSIMSALSKLNQNQMPVQVLICFEGNVFFYCIGSDFRNKLQMWRNSIFISKCVL